MSEIDQSFHTLRSSQTPEFPVSSFVRQVRFDKKGMYSKLSQPRSNNAERYD